MTRHQQESNILAVNDDPQALDGLVTILGGGGYRVHTASDGGETARTIGFLLNWMQEQQDVFVFATANDVRQLAPEQIQTGLALDAIAAERPEVVLLDLAMRGVGGVEVCRRLRAFSRVSIPRSTQASASASRRSAHS